MAISVRVRIKNQGAKDFVQAEIKRIQEMGQHDTELLAKRHESVIRYTIENATEGGTGKLANAEGWNAEPIKNGWGLGNIDKLYAEVPGWRHLNYGSVAIGANWQHFLPKGYWSNGRWVLSQDGYSGIMPQSPIEALNYIENSIFKMESEIPKILREKK